ncbi:hypothetical protein [Roseisolibacter sp. H3M3-2]|uniref:hypothetical protein n=1 Tax=Roseisolibacter sp. H3M3-2 TaxID=3031323 RepID=UPI0023D9FD94|nr:hypothetical protein [Roseisolibacter sp. H3M3-2]MDF1503789.1 hypothetical protein [Roseisolibacter sp. H3M3-2]
MRPATAALALLLVAGAAPARAQDRFTDIIARAPESSVRNGYVVNHRREAVQREITARPPTEAELGVRLPPGARLVPDRTALQIVQYNPVWRVYQYRVAMSREELVRFFTEQGLEYDASQQWLYFPGGRKKEGGFIDDLHHGAQGIRIWRRPAAASAAP